MARTRQYNIVFGEGRKTRMLVEHAREKLCPVKTAGLGIGMAILGKPLNYNETACTCDGPNCMLWQWHTEMPLTPLDNNEVYSKTQGFCGIACEE